MGVLSMKVRSRFSLGGQELMKRITFCLAVLVLAQSYLGQSPSDQKKYVAWGNAKTCRYSDVTGAACDSFYSDGEFIRIIENKGILLAVSFSDNGDYIVADIFLMNDTG